MSEQSHAMIHVTVNIIDFYVGESVVKKASLYCKHKEDLYEFFNKLRFFAETQVIERDEV